MPLLSLIMKTKNTSQWRSMNALLASREQRAADNHEFPEGASDAPSTEVDRRQFLGILGATTALAGVGLQGCMRKRTRNIVPFTSRPEDYLPGEARYYATNLFVAGEALPLLVRSNDGRPSKIDGNHARAKPSVDPPSSPKRNSCASTTQTAHAPHAKATKSSRSTA